MEGKEKHAKVVVSFKDGKPVCDPEWVHVYWEEGPDNVRWAFKHVPKSVATIAVEFLDTVPKKYKEIPGFLRRGPFRGMGVAEASEGSQHVDVVTVGNTRERGYFCYDVSFYDADGGLVARVDPGGTNDQGIPPGPTPPGGGG